MQVRLHKNATTTPKTRAMIQASDKPMTALAEQLGVTVETIARWKHRDTVEDRSHTPHRLQTTLSPAQEAVVLAIRETLWLSLDDLLAVARAAEGSMRDALSLTDQAIAHGGGAVAAATVTEMLGYVERELLRALVDALLRASAEQVLAVVADMAASGYSRLR